MDTEATRPPNVPPRWVVRLAWRVHRALYRLSGGRSCGPRRASAAAVEPQLDGYAGRRSTETPVIVLEPRDGTD